MSRQNGIRVYKVCRQLHPLKDGTGNTIGFYADDNAFEFSHWIDPELRDKLLANGELSRLYEIREDGASFIGYTRESAYGQSPNISPASITAAEVLANVGLSRFRDQDVSRGRVLSVQAKVKEFKENPSWRSQVIEFSPAAFELLRDWQGLDHETPGIAEGEARVYRRIRGGTASFVVAVERP